MTLVQLRYFVAIADAGFEGIEIFETDIVAHDGPQHLLPLVVLRAAGVRLIFAHA